MGAGACADDDLPGKASGSMLMKSRGRAAEIKRRIV